MNSRSSRGPGQFGSEGCGRKENAGEWDPWYPCNRRMVERERFLMVRRAKGNLVCFDGDLTWLRWIPPTFKPSRLVEREIMGEFGRRG